MNKSVGLISMEKMDNRLFNSVGSSRIRVRWLLPYWGEAEEYIIGKKYDVLLFQKVYWSKMMEEFKGVKILDVCDPDWLENKPVFEFVDMVDAVTTSTEHLAKFMRKMRPNKKHIICIPDRVYIPEAVPIKQDYGDKLKTLVWFGYSGNSHYLYNTYEDLIKRNIELVVISDSPIEPSRIYREKLKITNVVYNYENLNKELIKYDAVLMPDPYGDEKAKYKSNNKTLQVWALGLPVIIVPEDLTKFETAEARKIEGHKRRKEIEEKHDCRFSVQDYRKLIKEIELEKRESSI